MDSEHGEMQQRGPSQDESSAGTIAGNANSPPISVLYVDDEPVLLEPTRLSLEKNGRFQVDTSLSAQDALEKIQVRHYDVIVSDYQMPVMNGIQFLKRLRESGNLIPFIIFTGKGREDAVIDAYNAGADFYLAKGGNPRAMFLDLTHKIEQVVTRRRTEKALRASEQYLKTIFNSVQTGLMIIDPETHIIIDANPASAAMIGCSKDQIVGNVCHKFICPAETGRCPITDFHKNVDTAECILITGNGEKIPIIKTVVPVEISGKPVLLESVQDITDRKRAEDAIQEAYVGLELKVEERTLELSTLTSNLQNEIAERNRVMEALAASEEKYRSLVEQIGDIVFHIDQNGLLTYISPHVLAAMGMNPELLSKMPVLNLIPPEYRECIAPIVDTALQSRKPLSGAEIHVPETATRKSQVYEVNATPSFDKKGEFTGFSGIARDITERKTLQNEVAASLKEKEILLKEIHHRVKNNMQVISSLLNLQLRQMKDTTSREAIRESQNRVLSIALVHEKLYQSKSLAEIDYYDYLKKIAENLLQSYGIPAGKIRLDIHGENIVLPINRAIPISLMVNEILSNSLKYAFPGDRKGVITVDFHRDGGREILVVSDDGIGLPGDIDVDHTETLGLQLVHSLAGQALGTITL
ncbi:MAG: PAS domain S-box protein, partial [Methanoregula sp.]|nr:PAS domain S-box protein [Methanoregula sp.]